MGRGKSRVELDRAPEETPGFLEFPRVEALRGLARGAFALAAVECRLDRRRDARGDLVLYSEDVGQVAIVALGPEMPASGGFDQLCRHPHQVACLAHAALEHVAHAELPPDISGRNRFPLVSEGRIAGDDEQ